MRLDIFLFSRFKNRSTEFKDFSWHRIPRKGMMTRSWTDCPLRTRSNLRFVRLALTISEDLLFKQEKFSEVLSLDYRTQQTKLLPRVTKQPRSSIHIPGLSRLRTGGGLTRPKSSKQSNLHQRPSPRQGQWRQTGQRAVMEMLINGPWPH